MILDRGFCYIQITVVAKVTQAQRTGNAQDLLFTLFGDYLLHRPAAVWVGHLIELLRPLHIRPASVRTAISRMAQRGWLLQRRIDGRSGYELSARGRRLLERGEARIHGAGVGKAWDGHWYLLAYSIPEDRRHLRDRLRVRLSWLGFGQLGNGLWITPHDLRDDVEEIAGALRLTRNIDVFRAQHHGLSDVEHLVNESWDLEAINRRYQKFIDKYEPQLARFRSLVPRKQLSNDECFALRFVLIHEYRVFPFLDPYLPAELLPAEWLGAQALELFETLHQLLTEPAEAFVADVLRS